jgi:hypothetical protein
VAEKHKNAKRLADGAKSHEGLLKFHTTAQVYKSLLKSAQRSAVWKPSYLVSKPTFWSGVGDAFNVYGYFKPKFRFRDPREADARALYEDWAAVGADLERVLRRFEQSKKLRDQGRLFDPAELDKGA